MAFFQGAGAIEPQNSLRFDPQRLGHLHHVGDPTPGHAEVREAVFAAKPAE